MFAIHVSDETSSIMISCEYSEPTSGCDINLQTSYINVENRENII